MTPQRSNFIRAISKEPTLGVPLYCTGYPELEFINNYIKRYNLKTHDKNLVLNSKDFNLIEQIGFDAISLWDFRRREGGYILNDQRRVDGWGRIYKGDWYLWDGVFKSQKILENWEYLKTPSKDKLKDLKDFLCKEKNSIDYVISLPGLFEKTWQSMGFNYFSKCIKRNIKFVETIVSFFSEYLIKLIKLLQSSGAETFLIADDYGYKNRTFIPIDIWLHLFSDIYRKIIRLTHENNNGIIIHSDGYISEMIGIFIDLGFDAVQSLESNSGVDIFALFKKFQNQICFIGNLDISLLSFGTPQQVKDYVIKLIQHSKKYKCSLVISPTQQINRKCKPKNINAMIQSTKIFK